MPFAIPIPWREGKYHRLLFLRDKSKRNKSQEQSPCRIPPCLFCHKTFAYGPDLPIPKPHGNMKYSSDSEHSDMIVWFGLVWFHCLILVGYFMPMLFS